MLINTSFLCWNTHIKSIEGAEKTCMICKVELLFLPS